MPRPQGNQGKYDRIRNRVPGQCRWPLSQSREWKCPDCLAREPFRTNKHTLVPGECKFAEASGRLRVRHHPRAPAQRATDSPVSDLQAQDIDGRDINADVELPTSNSASSSSAPASSSSGPKPISTGGSSSQPNSPGEDSQNTLPKGVQRIGDEDAPAPSPPDAPGFGEDDSKSRPTRAQRRFADTGTGERQTDWSKFDVT